MSNEILYRYREALKNGRVKFNFTAFMPKCLKISKACVKDYRQMRGTRHNSRVKFQPATNLWNSIYYAECLDITSVPLRTTRPNLVHPA
ncbi:hypothetical protein FNV43_RR04363 [Rhamnella rubrinervis]|uniref:Uncharacterized protein n=1 Tax=Rhamnella rubrinervis TaxID=2594499 RepID=A0A8K0MPQ3_9ROSA|nr:hypothetical protein FNV43_RR04363 [Rhamnella rubrinervis]